MWDNHDALANDLNNRPNWKEIARRSTWADGNGDAATPTTWQRTWAKVCLLKGRPTRKRRKRIKRTFGKLAA